METKLMSSRDIVAILKKEGVNYKNRDTFDAVIWKAKRNMEIKPLIKIKKTLYYTEKDAQMIIKEVKGNYAGRKGVKTKKEIKENVKEVKKQEPKETQGIESIKKELELIKAEIVELRKLIVLDDPTKEIMGELNGLKEIINNKKFSIFGR